MVGGRDFVGDTYNADPASPAFQPVARPDDNPLDCNGHGTHVAGTAAGYGVTADGAPTGVATTPPWTSAACASAPARHPRRRCTR
ncbi:hypothetical protein A7K94_0220725 [Modestobacter sp. VKM Ac-2676]|nr:hypothetical protein A7K94_0220725 [Modestobacter sp. VKM Ac-2676]